MVDKDELASSFFPLSDEYRAQDFPLYWVARLNAKYSAEVDALLKPQGLSSSKWRVLVILHEQGRLSMSDIATHVVAKSGFELVMSQGDIGQHDLLFGFNVYHQYMAARLQYLFEATELVMKLLETKQAPFPGDKAHHNDCQHDKGQPTYRIYHASGISKKQNKYSNHHANHSTYLGGVNNVIAHKGFHRMEMLMAGNLGIIVGEHVDLRRAKPTEFQLVFHQL